MNSVRILIAEIRSMLGKYLFDVFAINESKIDSTTPNSEINIPAARLSSDNAGVLR